MKNSEFAVKKFLNLIVRAVNYKSWSWLIIKLRLSRLAGGIVLAVTNLNFILPVVHFDPWVMCSYWARLLNHKETHWIEKPEPSTRLTQDIFAFIFYNF